MDRHHDDIPGPGTNPDIHEVASNHEHDDRLPERHVPGGERGHSGGDEARRGDSIERSGRRSLDNDWSSHQSLHGIGEAPQGGSIPEFSSEEGAWQPALIGLSSLEYRKGPLPDPVTMAQYGEVDPTFPERIMRMAEKQLDAQTDAIRRAARATEWVTMAGGWMMVLLVIGSVVGFSLAIIFDAGWVGLLASLAPSLLAGVAQLVAASRGGQRGGLSRSCLRQMPP